MPVLTIDSNSYQKMKDQLKKSHEVGGVFVQQGNNLIPRFTSNGNSNSITVESNIPFNFHTHPGTCDNKMSCSLGMPSSQDMKQILAAAKEGNVAHFVVAHEGLYVVQVRCDLLQQYIQNASSTASAIRNKFKSFQQNFNKSHVHYDSFIPQWIQFANKNGFHVLFYPEGSSVQFQLNPPCRF